MTKVHRVFIYKWVAVFLLGSFSVQSSVIAQPVSPPLSESINTPLSYNSISIPPALGRIDKQFLSSETKPLVIYIQDAHAIVDAQDNIQKLIEYFESKYGVTVVALEGGSGELDAKLFKAFPDQFERKKVFSKYLKRGEITGAEMAAVFGKSKVKYFGIENWDLYQKNYSAYIQNCQKKKQVQEAILNARQALDQKRDAVYPKEMNQFHLEAKSFYEEKSRFEEFMKILEAYSEKLGKNEIAKKYPELVKLWEGMKINTGLSEASFSHQIMKMAQGFDRKYAFRLSREKQKVWNEKYQAFRISGISAADYLKFIVETAREIGVQPKLSSDLLQLLGQSLSLASIKGTELFDEIENLSDDINHSFAIEEPVKNLLVQYEVLRLLEALNQLELTEKNWVKIQQNAEQINIVFPEIWDDLSVAREFYRMAQERDFIFHENLKRILKKEKAKAAVVLTGGFHRRGFESQLAKENYSYIVVTPSIQDLAGQEMYETIMHEKVSYKKYLTNSYYDAFARHASERLVENFDEPSLRKNLKLWRDNVIRELAAEGKAGEAGNYTKFIDPLFKTYYEKYGMPTAAAFDKESAKELIESEFENYRTKTVSSLWSNFQTQFKFFSNGLKNLVQDKKIDPDSILNLMDQSSRASLSQLAMPLVFTNSPRLRAGSSEPRPSSNVSRSEVRGKKSKTVEFIKAKIKNLYKTVGVEKKLPLRIKHKRILSQLSMTILSFSPSWPIKKRKQIIGDFQSIINDMKSLSSLRTNGHQAWINTLPEAAQWLALPTGESTGDKKYLQNISAWVRLVAHDPVALATRFAAYGPHFRNYFTLYADKVDLKAMVIILNELIPQLERLKSESYPAYIKVGRLILNGLVFPLPTDYQGNYPDFFGSEIFNMLKKSAAGKKKLGDLIKEVLSKTSDGELSLEAGGDGTFGPFQYLRFNNKGLNIGNIEDVVNHLIANPQNPFSYTDVLSGEANAQQYIQGNSTFSPETALQELLTYLQISRGDSARSEIRSSESWLENLEELGPSTLTFVNDYAQTDQVDAKLAQAARNSNIPYVRVSIRNQKDLHRLLYAFSVGDDQTVKDLSAPLAKAVYETGGIVLWDISGSESQFIEGDNTLFDDSRTFKGKPVHSNLKVIATINEKEFKKNPASVYSRFEVKELEDLPVTKDFLNVSKEVPENFSGITLDLNENPDPTDLLLGTYIFNHGKAEVVPGALIEAITKNKPLLIRGGAWRDEILLNYEKVPSRLSFFLTQMFLHGKVTFNGEEYALPTDFKVYRQDVDFSENVTNKKIVSSQESTSNAELWVINSENWIQLFEFNEVDSNEKLNQTPGLLKRQKLRLHITTGLPPHVWHQIMHASADIEILLDPGIDFPEAYQKNASASVKKGFEAPENFLDPQQAANKKGIIIQSEDLEFAEATIKQQEAKGKNRPVVVYPVSPATNFHHVIESFETKWNGRTNDMIITTKEQEVSKALREGAVVVFSGIESNEPLFRKLQTVLEDAPYLVINGQRISVTSGQIIFLTKKKDFSKNDRDKTIDLKAETKDFKDILKQEQPENFNEGIFEKILLFEKIVNLLPRPPTQDLYAWPSNFNLARFRKFFQFEDPLEALETLFIVDYSKDPQVAAYLRIMARLILDVDYQGQGKNSIHGLKLKRALNKANYNTPWENYFWELSDTLSLDLLKAAGFTTSQSFYSSPQEALEIIQKAIILSHQNDPDRQRYYQNRFNKDSIDSAAAVVDNTLQEERSWEEQTNFAGEMLEKHRFVMFKGAPGVGKSYLATKIGKKLGYQKNEVVGPHTVGYDAKETEILARQIIEGDETKIQDEAIAHWAKLKNGGLLIIDEGNLPKGIHFWDFLRGVFAEEPYIWIQGERYPLTQRHRIIFTGNDETVVGRHFQNLIQDYAITIPFSEFSEDFLKDRVTEYLNAEKENRQQLIELVTKLFLTFEKTNPRVRFSLRDLQETCFRINSLTKINWTEKEIVSLIWPQYRGNFSPEEKLAYEQIFALKFGLNLQDNDKQRRQAVRANYKNEAKDSKIALVDSTADLLADIDEFLTLRDEYKKLSRTFSSKKGLLLRGKQPGQALSEISEVLRERKSSFETLDLQKSKEQILQTIQTAQTQGKVIIIENLSLIAPDLQESIINLMNADTADENFGIIAWQEEEKSEGLGQFLASLDQTNIAHYLDQFLNFKKLSGKKGILFEGPSGRVKDVLLELALKKRNVPYKRINASPDTAYVISEIEQAKKTGIALIISEINLLPSSFLEGKLNDILAGQTQEGEEGFMFFGTMNSFDFSGRQKLSTALQNRVYYNRLESYSEEELYDIALSLRGNEKLNWSDLELRYFTKVHLWISKNVNQSSLRPTAREFVRALSTKKLSAEEAVQKVYGPVYLKRALKGQELPRRKVLLKQEFPRPINNIFAVQIMANFIAPSALGQITIETDDTDDPNAVLGEWEEEGRIITIKEELFASGAAWLDTSLHESSHAKTTRNDVSFSFGELNPLYQDLEDLRHLEAFDQEFPFATLNKPTESEVELAEIVRDRNIKRLVSKITSDPKWALRNVFQRILLTSAKGLFTKDQLEVFSLDAKRVFDDVDPVTLAFNHYDSAIKIRDAYAKIDDEEERKYQQYRAKVLILSMKDDYLRLPETPSQKTGPPKSGGTKGNLEAFQRREWKPLVNDQPAKPILQEAPKAGPSEAQIEKIARQWKRKTTQQSFWPNLLKVSGRGWVGIGVGVGVGIIGWYSRVGWFSYDYLKSIDLNSLLMFYYNYSPYIIGVWIIGIIRLLYYFREDAADSEFDERYEGGTHKSSDRHLMGKPIDEPTPKRSTITFIPNKDPLDPRLAKIIKLEEAALRKVLFENYEQPGRPILPGLTKAVVFPDESYGGPGEGMLDPQRLISTRNLSESFINSTGRIHLVPKEIILKNGRLDIDFVPYRDAVLEFLFKHGFRVTLFISNDEYVDGISSLGEFKGIIDNYPLVTVKNRIIEKVMKEKGVRDFEIVYLTELTERTRAIILAAAFKLNSGGEDDFLVLGKRRGLSFQEQVVQVKALLGSSFEGEVHVDEAKQSISLHIKKDKTLGLASTKEKLSEITYLKQLTSDISLDDEVLRSLPLGIQELTLNEPIKAESIKNISYLMRLRVLDIRVLELTENTSEQLKNEIVEKISRAFGNKLTSEQISELVNSPSNGKIVFEQLDNSNERGSLSFNDQMSWLRTMAPAIEAESHSENETIEINIADSEINPLFLEEISHLRKVKFSQIFIRHILDFVPKSVTSLDFEDSIFTNLDFLRDFTSLEELILPEYFTLNYDSIRKLEKFKKLTVIKLKNPTPAAIINSILLSHPNRENLRVIAPDINSPQQINNYTINSELQNYAGSPLESFDAQVEVAISILKQVPSEDERLTIDRDNQRIHLDLSGLTLDAKLFLGLRNLSFLYEVNLKSAEFKFQDLYYLPSTLKSLQVSHVLEREAEFLSYFQFLEKIEVPDLSENLKTALLKLTSLKTVIIANSAVDSKSLDEFVAYHPHWSELQVFVGASQMPFTKYDVSPQSFKEVRKTTKDPRESLLIEEESFVLWLIAQSVHLGHYHEKALPEVLTRLKEQGREDLFNEVINKFPILQNLGLASFYEELLKRPDATQRSEIRQTVSQKDLKGKVENYLKAQKARTFVKGSILGIRLTQGLVDQILEVRRNKESVPENLQTVAQLEKMLGAVDKTSYSGQFLLENVGTYIGIQPGAVIDEVLDSITDVAEVYIIKKGTLASAYANTESTTPIDKVLKDNPQLSDLNALDEFKFLSEHFQIDGIISNGQAREMVPVSALFEDGLGKTLIFETSWGEGQTKPTNREGWIVILRNEDQSIKEVYLVNSNKDNQPLNYRETTSRSEVRNEKLEILESLKKPLLDDARALIESEQGPIPLEEYVDRIRKLAESQNIYLSIKNSDSFRDFYKTRLKSFQQSGKHFIKAVQNFTSLTEIVKKLLYVVMNFVNLFMLLSVPTIRVKKYSEDGKVEELVYLKKIKVYLLPQLVFFYCVNAITEMSFAVLLNNVQENLLITIFLIAMLYATAFVIKLFSKDQEAHELTHVYQYYLLKRIHSVMGLDISEREIIQKKIPGVEVEAPVLPILGTPPTKEQIMRVVNEFVETYKKHVLGSDTLSRSEVRTVASLIGPNLRKKIAELNDSVDPKIVIFDGTENSFSHRDTFKEYLKKRSDLKDDEWVFFVVERQSETTTQYLMVADQVKNFKKKWVIVAQPNFRVQISFTAYPSLQHIYLNTIKIGEDNEDPLRGQGLASETFGKFSEFLESRYPGWAITAVSEEEAYEEPPVIPYLMKKHFDAEKMDESEIPREYLFDVDFILREYFYKGRIKPRSEIRVADDKAITIESVNKKIKALVQFVEGLEIDDEPSVSLVIKDNGVALGVLTKLASFILEKSKNESWGLEKRQSVIGQLQEIIDDIKSSTWKHEDDKAWINALPEAAQWLALPTGESTGDKEYLQNISAWVRLVAHDPVALATRFAAYGPHFRYFFKFETDTEDLEAMVMILDELIPHLDQLEKADYDSYILVGRMILNGSVFPLPNESKESYRDFFEKEIFGKLKSPAEGKEEIKVLLQKTLNVIKQHESKEQPLSYLNFVSGSINSDNIRTIVKLQNNENPTSYTEILSGLKGPRYKSVMKTFRAGQALQELLNYLGIDLAIDSLGDDSLFSRSEVRTERNNSNLFWGSGDARNQAAFEFAAALKADGNVEAVLNNFYNQKKQEKKQLDDELKIFFNETQDKILSFESFEELAKWLESEDFQNRLSGLPLKVQILKHDFENKIQSLVFRVLILGVEFDDAYAENARDAQGGGRLSGFFNNHPQVPSSKIDQAIKNVNQSAQYEALMRELASRNNNQNQSSDPTALRQEDAPLVLDLSLFDLEDREISRLLEMLQSYFPKIAVIYPDYMNLRKGVIPIQMSPKRYSGQFFSLTSLGPNYQEAMVAMQAGVSFKSGNNFKGVYIPIQTALKALFNKNPLLLVPVLRQIQDNPDFKAILAPENIQLLTQWQNMLAEQLIKASA